MSDKQRNEKDSQWSCAECGVELTLGSVEVQYMGSRYPADLLRCEKCGQVYVPEELANTKMALIEKLLEDK
ncbi:MAG: hypothetical protein PHS86_10965 [Syntrophaceae bacterium]|nr:hypothetical protein [Syntrophaceae bacterium]